VTSPQEIPLPKLEATAGSEIIVAAWLKQPGDFIRTGEVIAEVLTDKVNIEIQSPVTGVLDQILAREGDAVAEGDPLARVIPDS
jgi:2-oxoglutarate dehydrogenase E2 component (dihydrolipoamide succinyltransferase)